MSTESRNDVEKTLLHTREVASKGYIRNDGMFDIEGIITDKKSYDIPKSDRTILKEGVSTSAVNVLMNEIRWFKKYSNQSLNVSDVYLGVLVSVDDYIVELESYL